jgi:SAM-dependent methyltransferase
MAVNDDIAALLRLLACPSCSSPLASESARLRCTGCGRIFPLHRRVPILHEGAASPPRRSLLWRLYYAILGDPRIYDFQQAHGGGPRVAAQVKKELVDVCDATLLDIGAGTGVVAELLPPETRYVWFDNDTLKLRGLLSKPVHCWAVLGDAARLPFKTDAAEWSAMVEVSHHLDDRALRESLKEAARVTRERFIFVDALRGSRLRSKLLWQLDLGRFPRREEQLIAALKTSFELEKIERFRVHHDHILCVCIPLRKRVYSAR